MTGKFGQMEWIDQVAIAVANAVQNGVELLSRTSISSNAHPDDGYAFNARTKEELLASQQLAANAGNVRAGKKVQDPAKTELGAPDVDDDGRVIVQPGQVIQSQPMKISPQGWLL